MRQRSAEFNSEFNPAKLMNQYYLRKLYKQLNIKKKKLIKIPANPKKYTPEVLKELLQTMQHELIIADLKKQIVY